MDSLVGTRVRPLRQMSSSCCCTTRSKNCRRWVVFSFILLQIQILAASENNFSANIDALQKKYSQMKDLKMDFVQNYQSPRHSPRTETGILYLRRPGMMRWEYQSPSQKLFVSDGKTIYFYLPDENQVQKTPVKESRDQRIPFLFLLGKGNLRKDFSKIEFAKNDKPFFEGNQVLYAYPKKDIDEFSRILMEFDPHSLQLQRITIFEVNGSTSEFVFRNIKENLGLNAQMFSFKVPKNVEVVGSEMEGIQTDTR
jgi:outer membrane lipoprotein carrier protein